MSILCIVILAILLFWFPFFGRRCDRKRQDGHGTVSRRGLHCLYRTGQHRRVDGRHGLSPVGLDVLNRYPAKPELTSIV